MDTGLRLALKIKTPAEIAAACGCKVQAVYQWERVPPRRVKAVARLTGIPGHVLRPDIVDAPAEAA